jgi:DNA-binding transcriptional LysR family regulator
MSSKSCLDITVDRDVQDEYRFARAQTRQTIRFVPKLLVNGTDGLREAALAGCGIIRLLACHMDDELRSGALVPILSDWQECSWPTPIAAYYRKTNPTPSQLNAFVRYLVEHFRRYNAAPRA